MPNRILREWVDSESVNKLEANEERHFVRIIQKADDFGRLIADPKLLRPLLYPLLLDQVREADIQRWNAACAKSGLIRLYSVEGKQYLEVVKFNQRLRAKRSKCPSDDSHPPGICTLETRGERREQPPTPFTPFGEFWSIYPKKQGKAVAEKAWAKIATNSGLFERMKATLEAQKRSESWRKEGGQFIPMPATWLNQRRWEDEIEKPQKQAEKSMKEIWKKSGLSTCCGRKIEPHPKEQGKFMCSICLQTQEWYKP